MKRLLLSIMIAQGASASAVELPNVELVEPVKRESGPGCNNPAAKQWENLGVSGVISISNRTELAKKALAEATDEVNGETDDNESSGSGLPEYLTQ
ncbi:hypothetical protein [Marinobacter salarius]|uniref:Uncharacterized protein n=1 Tax=Marinobacter salarius TaxID=1420917 RepID=A0A1W6KFP4_9GAMM|nr:hypothetical protein [Marinobacter salarius]ARM86221.1 hypothetical protein MARSALSMR5_04201 [Marinobacter salarius]